MLGWLGPVATLFTRIWDAIAKYNTKSTKLDREVKRIEQLALKAHREGDIANLRILHIQLKRLRRQYDDANRDSRK